MRPLIVDLGRDYRGGQHQAFLLAQGLRERGHAADLMVIRGSRLALRAKDAGLIVHEVGPNFRRLSATSHIRGLMRNWRVDLIHANEPHALTAAWMAGAHKIVPLIASRRVALPIARGSISLARYRAASRIIAVSHYVEKLVLAAGIRAERVAVVSDGVTIPPDSSTRQKEDARSQFGIPVDALCVGNAAALDARKGHALLLRAFAAMRAQFPGSVLLIWGEGPEQASLQHLAQELRISNAVKFSGAEVSFDSALAAMDVFAFPSHMEALGSALLAAMARGLPVVAVARDGMTEVIENGKNGLLVTSLEPGTLSAALCRLLSHPEESRALGEAARATIVARFSAKKMIDETLELYDALLYAPRDAPKLP